MAKYIDQSAAIARLTHLEVTMPNATMTDAKRALADMFPADVAPVVHGRWIERDDDWFATYYDCSVCGESWVPIDGTLEQNNVKYCPSCGAKMDGGETT